MTDRSNKVKRAADALAKTVGTAAGKAARRLDRLAAEHPDPARELGAALGVGARRVAKARGAAGTRAAAAVKATRAAVERTKRHTTRVVQTAKSTARKVSAGTTTARRQVKALGGRVAKTAARVEKVVRRR
jgi:hypothetical protein